jgi:two-component system chemotaxis response regulator CheY
VSIRILVVEDDPDSREFLATLLKLEGYTVVTANDGLEGIERVETDHPDIIISDICMPNLDGLEMVKRLRQSPEYKRIPIVMLSAFGSGNLSSAINVGANEALRKPVHAELLLQYVTKWIGETLRYKNGAME